MIYSIAVAEQFQIVFVALPVFILAPICLCHAAKAVLSGDVVIAYHKWEWLHSFNHPFAVMQA